MVERGAADIGLLKDVSGLTAALLFAKGKQARWLSSVRPIGLLKDVSGLTAVILFAGGQTG